MTLDHIKSLSIPEDRKRILDKLVIFLRGKIKKKEEIHLNFICTHNSRRSQFAQLWSEYFTQQFTLNIKSYSGGTEVTACHPNVISTLQRLGFEISSDHAETNPNYSIDIGNGKVVQLFSKLHTEPIQAIDKFAALMCCSDAGENCPFVPGTEITIPLYYTDPKWADGTENEMEAYNDCCIQIASEIYYVHSNL